MNLTLAGKEYNIKGKALNPTIKSDQELIIKRLNTFFSDQALKQRVSLHTSYKDETGAVGTSPKGFMMQINKLIKKLFDKSVTEINSGIELEALNFMRTMAEETIKTGQERGLTRKEIKANVYNGLTEIYEFYHKLIEI